MIDQRKVIIRELQKLAEEVFELKKEHRQKRPIVIEFSGSPKAGKTSCINSLELFLKRNGFTVKIVQERASICPVSDKQSPMFNLWTACTSLAGLIGTLENKQSKVDVLILDRGIFDALCWFEWLVSNSKMEEEQRKITENFLLMNELIKSIDIVFAFCVRPNISIDREYATLLTDKLGTIMNEGVLSEYLDAIKNTIKEKSVFFQKVFLIDTSEKNQDEVGKEVTERTLNTLRDLLMERIGYFELNSTIKNTLSTKEYFRYEEVKDLLENMQFGLRNSVENDSNLIQPIPIAVITNKEKNKILVIKKNKEAVSSGSPEKDKILLYIGGHPRSEDKNEVTSDFLTICRSALKREVKEEIGISIALNDIEPVCIYTSDNDKSKQHLAICFLIAIEEGVKLQLDSNELVLNKGKSKSGKFLSLQELQGECRFEKWSQIILERYFGIKIIKNDQVSLDDLCVKII